MIWFVVAAAWLAIGAVIVKICDGHPCLVPGCPGHGWVGAVALVLLWPIPTLWVAADWVRGRL